MDAIDTEMLMARVQEGDESAFLSLYRQTQGKVYRFALQMSGSRAFAEETVQEVYMVLIRQPWKFDSSRGTTISYLYGIARNIVRRLLHRRKIENGYLDIQQSLDPNLKIDEATPYARVSDSELVSSVRRAVLNLPEKYREVMVLCELQELSYSEAASVIGCRVGTIRSRLHRGRELLAQKLRLSTGADFGYGADTAGGLL